MKQILNQQFANVNESSLYLIAKGYMQPNGLAVKGFKITIKYSKDLSNNQVTTTVEK